LEVARGPHPKESGTSRQLSLGLKEVTGQQQASRIHPPVVKEQR
jgi:hypothetical protein